MLESLFSRLEDLPVNALGRQLVHDVLLLSAGRHLERQGGDLTLQREQSTFRQCDGLGGHGRYHRGAGGGAHRRVVRVPAERDVQISILFDRGLQSSRFKVRGVDLLHEGRRPPRAHGRAAYPRHQPDGGTGGLGPVVRHEPDAVADELGGLEGGRGGQGYGDAVQEVHKVLDLHRVWSERRGVGSEERHRPTDEVVRLDLGDTDRQ